MSAARVDDTHIELTFSELLNVASITKANDGGFVVADTVTPATTYAISAIAPGDTDNKVILTVATIAASDATGITVTYVAEDNGTVADVATIPMITDATGVAIAAWA